MHWKKSRKAKSPTRFPRLTSKMGSLTGKKIVLGVTGGIAAYKAVEIASRLRKAGAEVHVVMTREATEFVTELTFREITGQPVTVDMWAKVTNFNVEHIALARPMMMLWLWPLFLIRDVLPIFLL